ncbi:phosphotransferase family protein [Mycoplasmopsis columbina]|uniref:phosphotransferase family protein n=1 Tax=Mycoplasmopsis columbina TaxID=114881 RepID=UPI0004A75C29|nr:phosphotransferase [Mycoplasmopsis columbina]VEU76808.1 PTS lichenan-specific IIA component domain protein [Mycoplasmopsis columbina]
MKEIITTGHTNKSFKDDNIFLQEKVYTGFNHHINYEILKEFNFVPRLIENNHQLIKWSFIEGHVPEMNFQNLSIIASYLKELHNSNLKFPESNHKARTEHYREILKNKNIKLSILDEYASFIDELLNTHKHNWPLHNDLWPTNMVEDNQGKIYLIDWEYATMGDKHFELAYFIEAAYLDDKQIEHFLNEYKNYDLKEVIKNRIFVNYLVILWAHSQKTLPFETEQFANKINLLVKML